MYLDHYKMIKNYKSNKTIILKIQYVDVVETELWLLLLVLLRLDFILIILIS